METISVEKTDTMFRRLHKLFAGDETFTLKRIEHVLSQMIHFGDQDYVREYLDSSPESGIFVHGVDNDGESALSYAACERSPAIVKLLLDRSANANFQNKDGRTPLMQAALWGRYKSVRHLLKYGADKNLQDRDGFKAIQLAGLSDRNEEERYWRSGRKNQIYREVTQTANQAWRMIAHLLKDDDDQTDSVQTIISSTTFSQSCLEAPSLSLLLLQNILFQMSIKQLHALSADINILP